MEKRIFGVYDEAGRLRYIGATVKGDSAKLKGQIDGQMRQALGEIERGKAPNPRERLFVRLLKTGTFTTKYLTGLRSDWMELKRNLIQRARIKKLPIANMARGGEGSEGVPVKAGSLEKAEKTRLSITNQDAYDMHTLWRIQGKTQLEVAEMYDMSEKGVQKICCGYRRPEIYDRWMTDNPRFALRAS